MFFENSVFPITFSIPEEKMLQSIPKKTKLLSSLIPGDLKTYIYHTEKDYYEEYQKSCFAITTKKAGWDCMRHYEIVANGCLPYFPNLEECPLFTMTMLPKQLMFRSNILYEKMKKDSSDNKDYLPLLIDMMSYFKENLTTKAVSKIILQRTGFKEVKRILFLSGCTRPDYLRCLTMHGLKQLIGSNCHDYPKLPHMYTDFIGGSLYGKGFTYSKLLDPSLRNDSLDSNVIEDIKNNSYDIVIYGSYHRGMPLYDIVCKYYPIHKIILLCGEDLHCCDSSFFIKKGHRVFVREL
jgi:hypothetical protein